MNKSNSITARILAIAALIGALVLVVVVVSSETGGENGGNQPGRQANGGNANNRQNEQRQRPARRVYVVKGGDTLTVIAERTGVSVNRIQSLNPDLDPQALIPGQRLKLR